LIKNFGTIAFYTRRPVGRRRVKDRRVFRKQEYLDSNPDRRVKRSIVSEKNFGSIAFYTRRPVGRRRVKDRRVFRKQEYLDHNPERRVNIIDRRMFENRRGLLPEIMNTFGEKAF
jgi:hypothetical protein